MVKDAIDQICDVLEVQDPSEREEYTLYVITSSGALSLEFGTALDDELLKPDFIINKLFMHAR